MVKKKKKERKDQFGDPIGAEKTPEKIAREKAFVEEKIATKPKSSGEFLQQREKLKGQGLTGIEATTQIEQQNATRQAEIQAGKTEVLKQQALTDVPIPRAEDITSQTSHPFGEVLEGGAENILDQGKIPGISELIESNLGEAFAGVSFVQSLKGNEKLQNQVLGLTDYMIENQLTPEEVSADPYVQAILRLKLNENDIKVLNEGKADVGAVAAAIEGLPISSQVTKWTGGALTPTSAYNKINDLNTKVEKLTSKMDNWSEAISKNPKLADQYDDLISEAEQELVDAQSRIKLMIIQSPILQNAPEEVEIIQENLDKGLVKTTKLRSQVVQTKYGPA